jgi:hypothetical protein
VKVLVELLALEGVFLWLLVDGDENGAQESGNGHVAAGGGETSVLIESVGDLDGDVWHEMRSFLKSGGNENGPIPWWNRAVLFRLFLVSQKAGNYMQSLGSFLRFRIMWLGDIFWGGGLTRVFHRRERQRQKQPQVLRLTTPELKNARGPVRSG